MTSYSVLRSAQRATVIATWPGAWSTSQRGRPSQQHDLGELDPRDDDGFARILGQWTRQVPLTITKFPAEGR